MKYSLKSVSTWSAVKITFFLSLVLGFMIGVLYALFVGPLLLLGETLGGVASDEGAAVGIVMVIMPFAMAFISAMANTILVAIGVPLYNLLGRTVGGLEFELEPQAVAVPPVDMRPPATDKPITAAPPPPPPVQSTEPTSDVPTEPEIELRPPADVPPGQGSDVDDRNGNQDDDLNEKKEDDRPRQL